MSEPGFSRRKQQLLDKFLSGEIDQPTYDRLLGELLQLGISADDGASMVLSHSPSNPPGSVPSISITESRSEAERSALSEPIALLEAGTELGGFRLEHRLRRGGMGEVWRAYDATGERSVVIKVLPPELQRSPDEMARVKQTFNRVHSLQHQHICPLYLLGQDPRFGYFIVMKYLDGDTLSAYRKAFVKSHGSFSLREVARVLAPIAKALDYAHSRQIIHRDIKPQNIMLSADGSDVQLVDFGLAAEVRTSVMRVSQVQMETCGTYPYMAPEQWRGELQDARTDQYALAVVSFELLAGHLPFEGADPTILRMCVLNDQPPAIVGVDPGVNAALAKGLAKSRADRFQNCVSFLKSLCAPVLAKPTTSAPQVASTTSTPPNSTPPGKSVPATRSESPYSPSSSVPPVKSTATKPVPVAPPNDEVLDAADVIDSGSPLEDNVPSSRNSRNFSAGQPVPIDSRTGSRPSSNSRRNTGSNRGNRTGRGATTETDDVEDIEDVEFLEPDDENASSGRRSSKRLQETDEIVAPGSLLVETNARAMFVVSFLVAGACVFFVGLFGWFAFGGYRILFPSASHNNASSLAGTHGQSGGAGTGNGANGGQNPVRPADKNGPALRYRWADGKSYTYSVNVELEQDNDIVLSMTGNCSYSLGPRAGQLNAAPEEIQGTGTGFVVHAGGYLVTCQHVVEDASSLEVAIGGKKYPATVVVEDIDHDLAIIHIEAAGLPTLPLADSETVRLGEEVRAIGFPLSPILGDNVKATRGTISGINTEDGQKVFQIDAGINPGNSGGPLVNERGEAIGVNFAKLKEEIGGNVGFAVPINYAAELLAGEGVGFEKGTSKGPKLEGPDLVTRVSAATALITVSGGGARIGGTEHVSLRCNGMLTPGVRSKSGRPIDPGSTLALHHQQMRRAMSRVVSGADFVETDAFGRIHDVSGEGQSLPGFLGRLSRLVLEQLPSTRRPTWTHTYPVMIVFSEESGDALGPASRFRPRFRPPGFPPFPGVPHNEPKITKFPGRMKIVYTLQESVGDVVRIKKELDLEARDPAGGDPRVKVTGTGTISFDTAAGIPRSMDFAGTLSEKENNKTTSMPIKLTYSLNGEPIAVAANANAPLKPAAPMRPAAPVAPGKLVENDAALAVGTKLVAEWAGKWLPVEVIAVKPDGKVRIHWVGWNDSFDEDLPRNKLRFAAIGIPTIPGAPQPSISRPTEVAPQKMTREEIQQALVDIKEWNVGKANLAAKKLQSAIPLDECRNEVLQVLESLLKSRDQFQRKQAIDALATWAKPETVPVLLKCLDETALLVKLAAIDALGRVEDERAAKPLSVLVSEPELRPHALKALQSIGAKAESVIIDLLKHPESTVRQEACKMLKEFGTKAGEPALKAASTDADAAVAGLAKDALAAIAQRK